MPDDVAPHDTVLGEILAQLAERGSTAPFALLHRAGTSPDALELLRGPVTEAAGLDALAPPDVAQRRETLVLVPFRLAATQGMACHDDGAPLLVMPVRERTRVPLAEGLHLLPDLPLTVRDGGFDIADAAYEDVVRRVVEEEIGTGAGCNFVISRSFTGRIADYSPLHALAVFRNLLSQEQGAYWTFVVHTGRRTFVGATPERHVTLAHDTATMNPISGTYRYPRTAPTVGELVGFLSDGKETDELYMVLDEELKMMGAICDRGIRVRGPYLKEMAHLAHTEYFITGHTLRSAAEVLQRTMFAPTVVGSPLENAFRVVHSHERSGRGHYSGIIALVDRDASGRETLDSAIMIRTAEIGPAGDIRVGAGATLVRHSSPTAEAAETRAKASALLAAMGYGTSRTDRPGARRPVSPLGGHPSVRQALQRRNTALNAFWFARREHRAPPAQNALVGRRLLVVDAEDRFTTMLGQQLRALGCDVGIRSWEKPFTTDGWDAVLVGPGPGDPLAVGDLRIGRLHSTVGELLDSGTPFVAVCLSHQVLCARLGLDLVRRDSPNQGVQLEIDLFGARERVGFYNTFAAVAGSDVMTCPGLPEKVAVCRDHRTGEVHGLRGPGFGSFQFHPESVLTEHGSRILGDTFTTLFGTPPAPAVPKPSTGGPHSAAHRPTDPTMEPIR